jgi:imidazolonepropionase
VADITIFDVDHFTKLQYFYGINHTHTVIKKGVVVVKGGNLVG